MRFARLFWDLNLSHRSTVFVAGVGRSGTTWLANLLNERNQYRIMFEPFHRHEVPEAGCFEYHQYLRPDSNQPERYASARRILEGRCRSEWCDKENQKRIAVRRLIKEIRCNLMLKWLHENFPEMPLVLILRHPCAVANSWLRLNWGSEHGGSRDDLTILFSQRDLLDDYLKPFLSLAEEVRGNFERHVLVWCILNYVPLKQLSPGDVHLVFYEELCLNPEDELNRVQTFLGRKHSSFDRVQWERPSSQALQDSAVIKGGNLVESWRGSVPEDWITRTMEIVSEFGLDRIYSEKSRPNVDEAWRLLSQD